MHEIIDKKFYLGPKFGTLFNKKWLTISELLQNSSKKNLKSWNMAISSSSNPFDQENLMAMHISLNSISFLHIQL
jgi:hypothetical protein